jgi:hypothetical protein
MALSKIQTGFVADNAIDTAQLADDAITTQHMHTSMVTHVDAGATKAQGVTTAWTDTNLSGTITVPTGCTKIVWHMRGGYRTNGIGSAHAAYRLKVVNGGTTTYVGHGSWGFGIDQQVGAHTGSSHSALTYYANLLDYDTDNNQANMSPGNTYAITVQVKDSSANGSNLYTFGDLTTNVTYYPAFMTFMFF